MIKNNKQKDSKIIEVHQELIDILEELRNKVNDVTYGALNETLSYRELTLLCSKKIKKIGGFK